jgi:hypothetical protein
MPLEPHRLNLKGKGDDIVLIPQPSDDINDPLNWPSRKKLFVFLPIILFAALGNWVTAAPGSAIVLLMKEFHTNLSKTSTDVSTWCVFALGIGVSISSFLN